MDAQTVRTALGTIQSNPSAEDAWQVLSDSLLDSGGDLEKSEALALLQAARERHGSRGESDAVCRLLKLSLTVDVDTADECNLLHELAVVTHEDLFDGREARVLLERALSVSGGDADLQAKLDDMILKEESYQEQCKNYLAEAEGASDDEYRSAMLMRASEAEICFSPEPNFSKVIENLELSLRLDAANSPAARLLEVIYRRQGDWDEVIKVLERTSDRAPDLQTRGAAAIRLARLYQHRFQDQEKAAAAYDRVLETDPIQADAVEFVSEYYSNLERWDDLVRVYERPLKVAEPDGHSLLGEMFQVAMLHWKKREVAVDAEPWFARIQEIEPAHEGMLNFYREYTATLKDDAGLVKILQEARAALAEGDERIVALDEEIGSKQDDQASAQKSVEQFKSALRANPDDEDARQQLKDMYKRTQGHNALVELLRQELERISGDQYDRQLAVMREIAQVYRQYLKSDTALVGVLNQIVHLDGKLDEQDVEEVRELVSLYEKLSRPRDLLSSLKLLAEIVPDNAEKVSLYRQVGRRWLEQFSNVQHAMEAFAALHSIAPEDPEAIERLEDLYRKRRAWKELFALYEQQLSSAVGEARVPLLREMAQLAAERLSRVDDALVYYKEVLAIDPSRTDVLDRMEKHAERSKNWSILAEVLEKRLSMMPEDESRLPVLQKLGGVYGEHLQQPEDAIGTWLRLLQVQPAHPRAMRVLRDTYLKASRFDDLEALYTGQKELESLAEVLSTAADRNKDAAEKLDLSYRAAKVYEEGLGQAPRAIRSYERILSIDAKDPRAIARLLPLYEQEEKWGRMPALLEVLVELSDSDDETVAIFEKLIDLAGTKLADKRGAVSYARRAFSSAPDNVRAMELLDASARASGAWDEMVEALSLRLEELGGSTGAVAVAPDSSEKQANESKPKKKKRRKGKKGGAQATKKDVPEEASSSSPENAPVPSVDDPRCRLIALRLARIIGEEMGQVEEAIRRLKALAETSPNDVSVMEALDGLLRRESHPDDLRWLFEHRQQHADSSESKAAILCEWAAYEESSVGDLGLALAQYDSALEAEPSNVGALEAVARLALSQDKPERAAIVLAQHRDLLSGVEAAYKDAMLADLLADRLKRPSEALEAAQRALAGGAESGAVIPVLQSLVEIAEVRGEAARLLSEQYEAGGDSRQEADAVRALISETHDLAEQVTLYKKLADIYEEKLSEPGAALSVLVDALSAHPTDIELWDRAGPLASTAGRPTDLADAFRAAMRAELSNELALELARRAAELHESTLGDPQGAVPYYEKILSLEADDGDAFARLKEILTAGERWRELETLYDSEILRHEDEARRIEMLAEVALLAEDIMGDAERAIGYHLRILEMDPETAFALESLDRLYTRLERKEQLLELLQKRAGLAVGEEQQAILVRAATLALALHIPEQAMLAIEQVLSDEPSNYEARDLAEELLPIGSVRVRAALALEAVYEAKDEIRDLVRVLGVRVEALRPQEDESLDESTLAEHENDRRDLLRRIATLRDDRLHDDEGSFDVFAELAPLDPVDADLRDRLIDSGRRLGRASKVIEVLLAAAAVAESSSLRAEILLQAAPVQSDLLDDTEGTEATLVQILALRDDEPEAALTAARLFESILVGSERNQELSVNLQTQIDLEEDIENKSELLARLAHLSSDVLHDHQSAIVAWEARLAENSEDGEALQNLTELYEKAERYEDVARVLEQRRESSSDDKERVNLSRHLADVQERHLDDTTQAIDSYQAILDETGASAEVLSALVRLYTKAERWDELADTYERQADTLEDEVARLSALSDLGQLRVSKLEDVSGALEVYRRALSVDMAHEPSRNALAELLHHEDKDARLEAAEILHPIYEADGDHARLLNVVVVEAQSSDDSHFRGGRYEIAMTIAEDSLQDFKRGMEFAVLGAREVAGQGDLDTWLSALERLAPQAEARSTQVEVLQEIVTEIFDAEVQLSVQKRIAELKRDELNDTEGAIAAYRQALEYSPEDSDSLLALEELFTNAKQWQELLAILELRTEAATEDAERKALMARRGQLLAGELSDVEGAIEIYEQILDIDLDIEMIAELEKLYVQRERFDDLTALIQRRIDDSSTDIPDLRVKLAKVSAENQADVERALDELEQALAEDAQHEGAIAFLENLGEKLEEPAFKGRVASLLEPVYMVRADYDSVLKALTLRLDGSDEPDERRELVTRIAQIHEEQKEDYGAALEVTALLLADDPSDQLTLDEMERLAKVAGASVRLAEIFATQVNGLEGEEDDASARLCRRAGEIFAANDSPKEALSLLARALAFEPESDELFEAVDTLLQKVGTDQERVDLYREGLEHRYEPEAQERLLQVIAQLEENSLGNVDAAIEAHRRTIEANESNDDSLNALTRLYRQTENWTDLKELYQNRAENAGPIDGAQYRIALADLHMRQLGEHEPALDQLEEVVREQPEQLEALERLEAMRASDELRGRVLEILRPIYQAQDEWRKLIQLNEDRFTLSEDPMDKVAILRETAEFWENRGNDLPRATRVLTEAWKIEPEDEEVRLEIERISTMTEDWQDLGELYTNVLDEHPDMMGRREVVARLAEICDTRLEDPRGALGRYTELRQIDGSDALAIDATLRLSLLLGDWPAREVALSAKADSVYDDHERGDLLARLGALRLRTLDNPEGAIEAYERAFESNDERLDVCDQLIELYEARDEPGRLVDLYLLRVEGADTSDDLQFSLLRRAASLLETSLQDANRAIECLGRALSARPGDSQTIGELNRLYRSEELWSELLDNLRLEAGTAETSEARLSVRFDIAQILSEKLESFEEALEAYGVILDEKPDDERALDSVFALVEKEEHLIGKATELLVPALRQTSLKDLLVKALELRLRDEQEPAERADTLRTIAMIQEEDLNDPRAAFESFLRAISETPGETDLYVEVERLAESVQGWVRFAEVLNERAAETFDSDVASTLWIRLGGIYDEKLDEKEKAVRAYQAATEQVGDRLDLLDSLDRLYTALDDTAALVELLERRMALADTDEAQARLLCRQGQLLLDKQNEPAAALAAFRQALERDLHCEDASVQLTRLLDQDDFFEESFDILDGVYRDRPSGKSLATLHGRRVQRASSAEERLDMRRGLAQVLEDECQDPLAAQKVLQEGLLDDINDEGLRDEIERLLPLTDAWADAAEALLAAIDSTKDISPEVACELCERAAGWLRDRAHDAEGAEKSLLKALKYAPENDDVLEQLESLQDTVGRESSLLVTLRGRAGVAPDEGTQVEFLWRAQKLADSLKDMSASEEILREILESDADDAVALAGLTDLRRGAGDAKETYALLERRMDLEEDVESLRELRFERAELARDQLDMLPEATKILEQLREEGPEDTRVATALRQAYAAGKHYEELGDLIAQLMESSDDAAQTVDLKVGLARLRRDQFADGARAMQLLEEVYAQDSKHQEAAELLGEIYEEASAFEKLTSHLLARSSLAREQGDEGEALTFLRRAALLFEESLKDLSQAIEVWKKIREQEDTTETLEAILRLQLASSQNLDAAQSLEELCASLEGEAQIARRGELAELYRTIGDTEAVIRTLEGSLALDEGNQALRESLRKEYEDSGAWQQVADMIVTDAATASAQSDKVALLREAAVVHISKCSDAAMGATLLGEAAELAPDDRALLLELCDAYSASGRGNDAVVVLQKVVESYGGKRSKELGEIHRRLATAYLSQEEQEKALAELDRAFRIEPGNISVLKQLGEVALSIGDMKKAQQMFRALLLQRLDDKSPITKAQVFCRLGQVHQKLGETPKAKQMYERALQTDASLEDAKTGLASL